MDNLYKHTISISNTQAMIDITNIIKEDLNKSNVTNGIMVVYCPHTTAGITINENADPDVTRDMIYGFEKVYPTMDSKYRHFEGNSHAHLKSSTVGASQNLIINNGNLILGTWQDIYFCEFDGPRNRTFYVKIIEG
ncbi:secondary thiamine-phosphate synthase enzyme YjbQ [Clostridium septicum]|uniref:secondary thiamine-phosphate synthase enzyme YjbQ n=1 Tax=Clostridium septicum TaxID=1504 RepID=UPI0008319E22|nr:secondary thiamine-phosphate synthase enzyme YjbQ [Clostridium septicum]WLF68655.1 secondary thiamine-phosphate synthase enzyme YjbQ [Clostridium septicum]